MVCIGLDVHAQNFTACVLDGHGEVLLEGSFAVSAQKLRSVVGAIAGPKQVVFEETTVAAWVYRVLEGHADRIVVADPRQNAWISKDEKMDDDRAAHRLAQLLQNKLVTSVYHPDPAGQSLRELVHGYHDMGRESTRAKNKLKHKFRQHGIPCTGATVFNPDKRDEWLDKFDDDNARFLAQQLMTSVDYFDSQRQALRQRIARCARDNETVSRLMRVPGIGLIRAMTFYAIIDTPHRFADNRKLWSYCGIGLAQRTSDKGRGPVHLTRYGNRVLKNLANGAAISAIQAKNNQFVRQHERLIAKGASKSKARLTVARAIISTMWAMWRKGEPYIPRD